MGGKPEGTREQLEARKLRLEIQDLRYGWWRNSAPIVATLAIAIVGWFAQHRSEESTRKDQAAARQIQSDQVFEQRYAADVSNLSSANPSARTDAIFDLASIGDEGRSQTASPRVRSLGGRAVATVVSLLGTETDSTVLLSVSDTLMQHFDDPQTFSLVLARDRQLAHSLGIVLGRDAVVRQLQTTPNMGEGDSLAPGLIGRLEGRYPFTNGYVSGWSDAAALKDAPAQAFLDGRAAAWTQFHEFDRASLLKQQVAFDTQVDTLQLRLRECTKVLAIYLSRPRFASQRVATSVKPRSSN